MLGKYKVSIILLLILILLTVGTFLQANDLSEVLSALSEMSLLWLALGILLVLLFVIMEGVMIWYLLRSFQKGIGLYQCISWSFVGFFVSGITPSATGGQPMQIYYMKRAGIQVSASMPVLMILAVLYKLVMVGIGIGICFFWSTGIAAYFGDYLWLLTWIIYRGLGLSGVGILSLMALQAAVTLSVDLLPLPGSMGISELVFSVVFTSVFSEKLLPVALCISRGISFYLIMIVSAAVFAWAHFSKSKAPRKEYRDFLV